MHDIIRNVRDIDVSDRHALEHVVGQPLRDDQRLVIQIVNTDTAESTPKEVPPAAANRLPDWCNVYEGLSDAEIADLETAIVRSHDSRSVA